MSTPGGFPDAAATWDSRFGAEGYLFGTEPNEYLRRHAGLWLPGQRVLCVADGEGRNSVFLAQRGLHVDAFDISAVGVAKARQLAAAAGVTVDYSVSDCEGWDWPVAAYDGVAAIFIQFADPEMRARLFARMAESLKPGGVVVLQGYTPEQVGRGTGGPPQVSHMYTEEMLRAAFGGMEILELMTYNEVLDEGAQHRGYSSLIGMVARKR